MNRLTNTSVDSRDSGAVRLFCDTQTALKKLKKYEDTELSPAEVKEIKHVLDEYKTVFAIVEHMIDVSDSDNVDDQERYIKDGWSVVEIPAFIGFLKSLKNIGKSIFFSKEEAERQMEEIK